MNLDVSCHKWLGIGLYTILSEAIETEDLNRTSEQALIVKLWEALNESEEKEL